MNENQETLQRLQDYLYQQIPLSRAMEARLIAYDEAGLKVAAPLQPNSNHQGTAFGGSIYSLMVLAGWSLLYLKLKEAGLPPNIVIQDGRVHYRAMIEGNFLAQCPLPSVQEWTRFLKAFSRYGKARLRLTSMIADEVKTLASFVGEYVVQR